jgi:hypothetical protein
MIKTSHIGSLPFNNTNEADRFNSFFDLPVLYTLPNLDKSQFMLDQVLGEYKKYSKGILKRSIKVPNLKAIKDYDSFKYQMVGPITLIKSLQLTDQCEIEDLLNWYIKQLRNLFSINISKTCYFFLDEPMLFMATKDDYILLNNFLSSMRSLFLKVGIHCCSEMKPELLDFKLLNGLSIESKYINQLDLNLEFDLFLGVLDTKEITLDPIVKLDKVLGDVYVTPHCGLAFTDVEKMHLVSKNLTAWANMAQVR